MCWLQAGLPTQAPYAGAADDSNSADGASDKPTIKRFKLLSQNTLNRTLARNSSPTSTLETRNSAEAELHRYLNETDTTQIEIPSAVDFWQDRQKTYPTNGQLALDIITCPASQAYVERAFSLCGNLCARKKPSLCYT
jgi:hAT family C-terminal dimerisation region